jgi:hypothetical protein
MTAVHKLLLKSKKETGLMEITENKEGQPADSQKDVDSMNTKMMEVEDERRSLFPNGMNYVEAIRKA